MLARASHRSLTPREGFAMQREGSSMQREGSAMQREGSAMQREGTSMQREGSGELRERLKLFRHPLNPCPQVRSFAPRIALKYL
jgi:hypothetical protein